MTTWQVQTAKQRFSELVRAAETGQAQFITRHGEPVAVVIDISEYRRTHEEQPRESLGQFLLRTAPRVGDDWVPDRPAEPDRVDELVESWLGDVGERS